MLMEGGLPNFFTINGKAYTDTNTIHMRVGDRVLLRFIGSSNNLIHPMHVHGGPFTIIATDGNSVASKPGSTRTPLTSVRGSATTSSGPPERRDGGCCTAHHTGNNDVEETGSGAHHDYRRDLLRMGTHCPNANV